MLLYDENNKLNTILIKETDFIPLQKSNAKEIVSYLNSNFIFSDDPDVREYKKIENRYREFDDF